MTMAGIFAFAQEPKICIATASNAIVCEQTADVHVTEEDGKKTIAITISADSIDCANQDSLEIIKKVIVIDDNNGKIMIQGQEDIQQILDSLEIDLNMNLETLNSHIGDIEGKCETIMIEKLPLLKNEKDFHWIYNMDNSQDHSSTTPFMGITASDLTFQEAYEMHYPYNFGVELTSVITGTNANRAGLMAGDIVMKFDGIQVRGENHLTKLIRSKNIGDTVEIVYFRNEEERVTNLTFAPKQEEVKKKKNPQKHSKFHKTGKLSPGFGGGGPYVKFIDFDYEEINNYIESFGFAKIQPERTVYFGGGGMGNIGKGWFLGGNGYGFLHNESIDTGEGKRHLTIENGFGGVALTKKIPVFTERLVMDFGLMFGGGIITLEIGENNGFSWNPNEIHGKYQKYHKNYFAGEATVGLMWRVKNWFGFHGQFGKMETFTLNDHWTENTYKTDTYTVDEDAPEIPSGLTYTAGIWFGF